jgi:endonuclease YncB( thermonuclease family)
MLGQWAPCFAVFACAVLLPHGGGRAEPACELSEPETGTVVSVIDGETLELAGGRTVRLIGAKAPAPPLGWRGDDPWPFVEEAREALATLVAGARVELRYGGERSDRYGHALAHVFVGDGESRVWVQGALVGKGLARVYSFADNRACAPELLAREQDARAKRLGVWRSSAYRIQEAADAERLGRLIHGYQLVEGTVVAVGEGRGRLYLNFAEDWRRDFTVSVERKHVRAFTEAGIDLKGLAGKRVRARGWLAWWNGPMIEATHPEQIEVLGDRPPS